MYRTTIMLPDVLKAQVMNESASLGISLGEFVRNALSMALNAKKETLSDTLFSDTAAYAGKAPRNSASQHDEYLYGNPS